MEDEIYKILENVPDVYEGWYRSDINRTHVTFFTYNTVPEDFSDCDYESITNSIQVDVWGTDEEEVRTTDKQVKKLLKQNDFLWSESNRDFETETELYHYSNRFNYLADADS